MDGSTSLYYSSSMLVFSEKATILTLKALHSESLKSETLEMYYFTYEVLRVIGTQIVFQGFIALSGTTVYLRGI